MKILIADDDPAASFILDNYLTDWGYEVVPACDGNEAWKILQQDNSPNLALLRLDDATHKWD